MRCAIRSIQTAKGFFEAYKFCQAGGVWEGKPRKFYFFPWASNKGKDSWQNIEGMRCSKLRDPMQRGNNLRCGRSAPEEGGMTDLIQRSAVGKETTGRKKTTHLGTTTPLHDPSMQWMRLLQNSVVLLLRLSTAQPLSTSFLPLMSENTLHSTRNFCASPILVFRTGVP